MSRSYKKNPFVNDHKCRTTKHNKQIANRIFRRNKSELYQGSAYKKCYCSWNISDYGWRWTKEEAIDFYLNGPHNEWAQTHYETVEDYLQYWAQIAHRK